MDEGVREEKGRRPPGACRMRRMDGAHERTDAPPAALAWAAGGGEADS